MFNDIKNVSIMWKRYTSYDDASSDLAKGIYIHDWQNKPYYVGKLDRSNFGIRYNKAYRHWIDGCLEHGARLFIGSIDQSDAEYIEDLERTIIQFLKPVGNHRQKLPSFNLKIAHKGQVPEYLQ